MKRFLGGSSTAIVIMAISTLGLSILAANSWYPPKPTVRHQGGGGFGN
jgi:hypothetical protein